MHSILLILFVVPAETIFIGFHINKINIKIFVDTYLKDEKI